MEKTLGWRQFWLHLHLLIFSREKVNGASPKCPGRNDAFIGSAIGTEPIMASHFFFYKKKKNCEFYQFIYITKINRNKNNPIYDVLKIKTNERLF